METLNLFCSLSPGINQLYIHPKFSFMFCNILDLYVRTIAAGMVFAKIVSREKSYSWPSNFPLQVGVFFIWFRLAQWRQNICLHRKSNNRISSRLRSPLELLFRIFSIQDLINLNCWFSSNHFCVCLSNDFFN